MSADCVVLSPPASKITTSRPRCTKYTVYAIPRNIVDAQLGNPFTDGLHISRIARSKTLDSHQNARAGLQVPQRIQPLSINFCFANLSHGQTVSYGPHRINHFTQWARSSRPIQKRLCASFHTASSIYSERNLLAIEHGSQIIPCYPPMLLLPDDPSPFTPHHTFSLKPAHNCHTITRIRLGYCPDLAIPTFHCTISHGWMLCSP